MEALLLVKQTPLEHRHCRTHGFHYTHLHRGEAELIDAQLIRDTCLIGEADELVERITGLENDGMQELMFATGMPGKWRQAEDFARQVMARLQPTTCFAFGGSRVELCCTRTAISEEWSVPTAIPQPVVARLTRAAIFLVVTVNPEPQHRATVRSLCGDLSALLRAVGFRDLQGGLSCVMAFGSDAWDRLFGSPRPKDLHPFREIRARHHAVSTPGDILFHIRARRMDLCFELAAQIMSRIRGAVTTVDEVQSFTYFDDRDLIGFVDGTENPTGQAADIATLIGEEDPAFAGGSYVLVQKYIHDLQGWNALPVEQQERIIGRMKLSDIELDDAVKPTSAHNVLTTIIENGEQLEIVRDNMPFGELGKGELGTYFIGYAPSPHRIEQMVHNMFVGRPPGNYDRLLDFSRAVTGTLFFVPTATFLDNVAAGAAFASPSSDGPLGIGSLKEGPGHEQPSS